MAYKIPQHQLVKLPAWRRRLLLIAVLLGFMALLTRAIYLQSLHKDFLQQKGDARYSRTLVLQAHRGKITDRNGELLAVSSPVESVWVSPPDLKLTGENKKALAKLLQLKLADI
ncbi:MAG TPA: penicillin-binding protein 2, partial [Methylophilus sp.]|nr:penicillin-binding protein 2 [Methylophilus sp.]